MALAVGDVEMNGYKLSVTTRDNGDDPKHLEELTFRTVNIWLWIVGFLEQGVHKLPDNPGSVESRYAAELNKAMADTDAPRSEPITFERTFGDARVTVWDLSKSIKFHLNSDDDLQVAVNTWLAQQNALKRLKAEHATPQQKVSAAGAQQPVDAQKNGAAYNPATDTPAQPKGAGNAQNSAPAPQPAVEGAIVATRPPNSNRPDYANGQLVSFTVTKIVASSNKGSAVYQMWTPLGNQYPTISVYKLKPDGNLKPDYEAIVPVLNTLNLSLDKPEAVGTWRLVCKAAHVPNKDGADREFLNVVSLTAI